MEHNPLLRLEDDFETDDVHHPYTAFNQGWDAAKAGIPMSLNPYDQGSREAEWWEEGYYDFEEQHHMILVDKARGQG